MHVGRELPDLTNESLQRPRGRRPEQPHDIARNAGRASGEQRKTRANDAKSREYSADPRQLNRTPQEPRLVARELVSASS